MHCKIQTGPRYERILLVRLCSLLMKEHRPFAHFSPPLSLKYIESLLEISNDIQVKLLDCHIRDYYIEDAVKVSCDFNPDLLIIDINLYEFPVVLNYLELLKRRFPSLIVIAIGSDPTVRFSRYREFLNYFNIFLPGESEREIVNILNELNNGKDIESLSNQLLIQNKQGKEIMVTDLDSLPFPKYSQDEIRKYQFLYPIKMKKRVQWGFILSSRGCSHRCIFCSPAIRKTFGKAIRLRSAPNVVDEIEYLVNTYKVNVISFEDDDFTLSRTHVENICNEILERKVKIKWVAHARLDEVDHSLLSLMKKAGCDLLRFGVEAGSERIISLLKKTNKSGWIKQAISVFNDAKRIKISTNALFMLGNPTETEEEIMSSIWLAKKLKPDLIQIHFFTPYPGTQIYNGLKFSLGDADIEQMYHYATPFMTLSKVSIEKLRELYFLFYRNLLFSPDFLAKHMVNYGFFYFFNKDIFLQLLKRKYF